MIQKTLLSAALVLVNVIFLKTSEAQIPAAKLAVNVATLKDKKSLQNFVKCLPGLKAKSRAELTELVFRKTKGKAAISKSCKVTSVKVTDPSPPLSVGALPCVPGYLAGDITRNGTVDFADLIIVSQCYGKSASGCYEPEADVNRNGTVDFPDLLSVAQNFGVSVCGSDVPTSTPTRTPTATLTYTVTPIVSIITPTVTPTRTVTPTNSSTATPSKTVTSTPTKTPTAAITRTITVTPTVVVAIAVPTNITWSEIPTLIHPQIPDITDDIDTSGAHPETIDFESYPTGPTKLMSNDSPEPLFPLTTSFVPPADMEHFGQGNDPKFLYTLRDPALADHSMSCGAPFRRNTFNGSPEHFTQLQAASHYMSDLYDFSGFLCRGHFMMGTKAAEYQSSTVTLDKYFSMKPKFAGDSHKFCVKATLGTASEEREFLAVKFSPDSVSAPVASSLRGQEGDTIFQRIEIGGIQQALYGIIGDAGQIGLIGSKGSEKFQANCPNCQGPAFPSPIRSPLLQEHRQKHVKTILADFNRTCNMTATADNVDRKNVCYEFNSTNGTDFTIRATLPGFVSCPDITNGSVPENSNEISYSKFSEYPFSTDAMKVQLSCDGYHFLNTEVYGPLREVVASVWHVDDIFMSHAVDVERISPLLHTNFHPDVSHLDPPSDVGIVPRQDGVIPIDFSRAPPNGAVYEGIVQLQKLRGPPDNSFLPMRLEVSFDNGVTWLQPKAQGTTGIYDDANAAYLAANKEAGNWIGQIHAFRIPIPNGSSAHILNRCKSVYDPARQNNTDILGFCNIQNPVIRVAPRR